MRTGLEAEGRGGSIIINKSVDLSGLVTCPLDTVSVFPLTARASANSALLALWLSVAFSSWIRFHVQRLRGESLSGKRSV